MKKTPSYHFVLSLGVVLLTACASDPQQKYASLENLSDSERNEALKGCFDYDLSKTERQDCLLRYAPPEVGYKCERIQVSGTRFSERVCSTTNKRDWESAYAKETLSKIQRNSKSY